MGLHKLPTHSHAHSRPCMQLMLTWAYPQTCPHCALGAALEHTASLLCPPSQGDAKSTQTTLPYIQHAKRMSCPQGKAMPSGNGRCHPHRNNPHPEQSPSMGMSGKATELGAGEVYSPFNLETLTHPIPTTLTSVPIVGETSALLCREA